MLSGFYQHTMFGSRFPKTGLTIATLLIMGRENNGSYRLPTCKKNMNKKNEKTNSKIIEGEVVNTDNSVEILALPGGYLLSGNIRFRFGEKEERFSQLTERLDSEIVEFRNQMIKKIARELGLGVNFTE